MGIHISHNEHHVTFKALYRELKLADEGFAYNFDEINISDLMEKVDFLVKDRGEEADEYIEWMEESGRFVFGDGPAGRSAFAVLAGRELLLLLDEARNDGLTTIYWG